MLHPSLTGRRILLSVLTILVSIPTGFICIISPRIAATQNNACLNFLQYLVHPLLRFCTASTGSFGLVVSIALLLKPPATSWANVFERLWVSDGVGWGTSQEKGLTAGWAFFAFIGIVGDWALKRWFGEDPDEVRQFLLLLVPVVPDCIHLQKWDDYLSSYVESLPFSRHRAGTFKPLPSLWDRLFHRQTHPNPRSFEDDPSLAYLDIKSKALLTDDLTPPSSPFPKSAIPDPFYADTPPPPTHLTKSKHKLVNADHKPGPPSDTEAEGASDSSDEYDLPPFVKRRRKNGPFAKLRLRLRNPESQRTRPADPAAFIPLAQRDDGSDSDEDKKRGPSDDRTTTASSATLIDSGGNRQIPSWNSEAHAPASGRLAAERPGQAEKMASGGIKSRSIAREPVPEYSDYEVDLTSMAPSPYGPNGERRRAQIDTVPKFMERHMSSPKPQTPISETSSTAPGTPESPSATDRARARIRAIVAGVPTHPSRRGSLAQMPQLPSVPPPLHHGSPHNEVQGPTTAPLSPVAFPVPVPATPSLLDALHRVAVAQQQAYDAHAVSRYGVDGLPAPSVGDASISRQGGLPGKLSSPKKGTGLRESKQATAEVIRADVWDDFWRDVKAQARVPIR